MKRCYISLICTVLLFGCSSTKRGELKDKTVDGLYAKACNSLKSRNYTDAAEEFKEIDILFPYSSKACEGRILAAYSYFMASSYLDAMREIEIFLRYHSNHSLVVYATYLRSMCLYMQVSSVGRDAKAAKDAQASFRELIEKYPESIYHNDCVKRIMILDDILAAHMMMIGRYYQKNKNALAAIGRYNYVITQLPTTTCAQEAYYRIAESCMSMGLKDEAKASIATLKASFPRSKWLQKADNLYIKIVDNKKKKS